MSQNLLFESLLLQVDVLLAPAAPSVLTQILTALLVGLLTAFALQVVLTSVGVAVGTSALRFTSTDPSTSTIPEGTEAPSKGKTRIGWGTIAGFGVLLTVNLVLFTAALLAVKFSQVDGPWLGAIAGISIWSAYLLVLLWVGLWAAGKVAGTVLNVTTGGLRRLVNAVIAAIRPQDDQTVASPALADLRELQHLLQPDQLRQLVMQQVQAIAPEALSQPDVSSGEPSPDSTDSTESTLLEESLRAYLLNTSAEKLTPKRSHRKLKKILQHSQMQGVGSREVVQGDRLLLQRILDEREDLSDSQKQRILQEAEKAWVEVLSEQSSDVAVHSASEPEMGLPGGAIAQAAAPLVQAASGVLVERIVEQLPQLLTQPSALPTAAPALANLAHTSPLEALQQTTQHSIDAFKQQTQQQLDDTRRAVASVTWWLVAIATTGVLSAALAGAVAAGSGT